MKLITWNINGYRSIIGQNKSKRGNEITNENRLFNYINEQRPDVFCLQETKSSIEQISEHLRFPDGYTGCYNSAERKGYSGVATFIKKELENKVRHNFGIKNEKFDNEGRVIITELPHFALLNIYFPNGTSGDERLAYKMQFYKELFLFLEEIRKAQPNIIICGDYNIAHKAIDLANPKANEKNSGFLPEERELLDYMVSQGWVDAFREFNKEAGQYSWWSNFGQARNKNIGWRIDYFFITPPLKERIKNCYLEPTIKGSDHCPLILEME